MSGPDPGVSFTAEGGSSVGFQAGEVSGGTFYIDAPTYRLSSEEIAANAYEIARRLGDHKTDFAFGSGRVLAHPRFEPLARRELVHLLGQHARVGQDEESSGPP